MELLDGEIPWRRQSEWEGKGVVGVLLLLLLARFSDICFTHSVMSDVKKQKDNKFCLLHVQVE